MTKSESYISFIVDKLSQGETSYVIISSQFCTKFHKTQRTFASHWKKAQERYAITQQKAQEVAEAVTLQEVKENASNAIKTKIQRLEVYQKQIDDILSELENGMTEELLIVSGQPKKTTRKHTVSETALLRRTLRDLQSEISKIEGDYAATKTQVEVKQEQPLFPDK